MEYFNYTDNTYFNHLKSTRHKFHKIKVELLSEFETVIGEITNFLSKENQGQININYQQLVRRSCSLSLINTNQDYSPREDSFFWLDRKFKLWMGTIINGNIYWFSFGIFLAKSVQEDNHILSIEGVDKGGILDGTLKTNMITSQVLIEQGSSIAQLFRDTLLLSDNHFIADPIKPIIDKSFESAIIETDISLNRGEYVGNLLKEIADSYGADIFYNVDGQFNLNLLTEGNRGDGYNLLPSLFDFTDENITYIQPNINCEYDYVNAVTVYTNITAKDSNGDAIPNVSYTAYNNNPLSPLRISAVRIRQLEPQEIKYINTSEYNMQRMCKEYANYLLFKNSMVALSISFNSQLIPHLDVNKIITITDVIKNWDMERFVIQSITIPLSSGEMSIQATNVQTLPVDINMEGRNLNGRLY